MTRKFCTRWEFLPPPIAEGQGFARARGRVKYPPKVLFHSRVPTIPGNTINRLALGGQTPSRFGARDVSFHVLGLQAWNPKMSEQIRVNVKPFKLKRASKSCPWVAASCIGTYVHACCPCWCWQEQIRCLFACWRSMAAESELCMNCFQDSIGFV